MICLSVSTSKVYHRTENEHPVLGVEYKQEDYSLTDEYFQNGLKVRYFMPPHGVAPLAFYFTGDLLSDYTNLELISTISTMEPSKRFTVLNLQCKFSGWKILSTKLEAPRLFTYSNCV